MADEDDTYGADEHDAFETEEFDQDDVDGGTRDDVIICVISMFFLFHFIFL